jgi:single-strand DNA-binding protein
MKGLNKVFLIGHVGHTPDIKTMTSGHTVARFTMATSETIRKADGTKHTDTQWHNLVAWNSLVQVVEKIIDKGAHIHITGKLQYRSYTTTTDNIRGEAVEHYITEIVVEDIILLDKKIEVVDGGE